VVPKTLTFQRVVAELLEQVGRFAHGDAFLKGLNPAQWTALPYFARANQVSRGAFNSGKWASKVPRLDSTTLECRLGQDGGVEIETNLGRLK
jgi:hypothetical protein